MASTDAKAIPVKNVALRITFPILDADGDLVTGATSPDSEISKDGGTFADCTNEATEIATNSGMYYLDLTSTEMDADTVAIIVKSGTGKTTPFVIYTAARNINDLAFPTTTGRSIDVTATGAVGVDWANVEGATTTVSLTNTTVATVTTLTGHTAQTGDSFARLGAPAGASIAADIAVIESQTDDIGTAGAGLTAVPWNPAWDAEVESEVADGLAAYDPPTKAELDSAVAPLALEATAQSILTDTAEIGAAGAGLTALASASNLATVAGYLDTEVAAIKAVTDKLAGLVLTNGTIGSTGNTTTTLHLPGLTFGDDEIVGQMLVVFDVSTSEAHVREITDWVLSTELATVATLPFTPQNATDTYWLLAAQGAPTVSEIQSGLATAAALATVDGIVDDILADTADMQPKIGTPAVSLAADIADLPTNAELATSQAAADDATLAAIAGLNNLSAAQVNAEVDTALADIHLDHLLATTYDPASKPGAADALLNELVEDDGGVSRYTANALEQAPTGGSAPTAAQIADAVWDEAQADHVAVGSFGIVASEVADILVDTSTTLQAELDGIQADTEDLQAKVGTPAGASVSADIAAVKAETATILADTAELQGDWVNGGRLDLILDARASQTSVDDLPTNAELATALGTADDATLAAIAAVDAKIDIIDTNVDDIETAVGDLPTNAELATALGTADDATLAAISTLSSKVGTPAGATVSADIAAIKAETASILTDTAEIGAAGAGLTALATAANLATVAGYLDTEVAAIKAKTDSLTFTVAGVVDANVQRINDVTITGDGQSGTEFSV